MPNYQLTADLVDGQVQITGNANGNLNVPKGSPPTVFTFNLHDNTGLNVEFLSGASFLNAANGNGCPACGTGNQVPTELTDAQSTGRTASFKDQNSQAGSIGFSLCFSCGNGSTPIYDPVIINGGRSDMAQ